MTDGPERGFSAPAMRVAECKDCGREVRAGKEASGEHFFRYPQSWADGQHARGGSVTDRCPFHRGKHQQNIAGMAIAYIDLETVGEVADRSNPSGPLGGLGPLPQPHTVAENEPVDLGAFGFGMDESHIKVVLANLADPARRVLVVKAGTGTGKSTYMPYRLLDPPAGSFRLADLGPIVVTEPRVQATVGVAEYVGRVLSGAGGVGPGFPVGFQVSGNRQHDSACQLVYVTDGTMINWMREGRLSQIGTVIVDEAHERSTNIDFILGYLKRELPRFPHLRVIVTSATFNAEFYRQYFKEHSVADVIDVEAVKSIGYGWPLFPDLDVAAPSEANLRSRWEDQLPQLPLRENLDTDSLVTSAWPAEAPALKENETRDPADVGWVEDLHDTTRKLLPLRFQSPIPARDWKTKMPEVLGRHIVQLANGLDKAAIYGDILGFLPTGKNIATACEIIRAGVGDRADVFALLSSLPADEKRDALAPRAKGDKRKIVVSTNLAETSLTVEGVRFVVDSGLIAQSEWEPANAEGGIKTKAHSQAGIRQRWGRVGRKSPGWVFPLYTKEQHVALSEDTDPGSTRSNLEQLIMTAKLAGIDDVVSFPWPAAFAPEPPVELDRAAIEAQAKFRKELVRANEALGRSGAIDDAGDPTSFGKELGRFAALGSAACAVAVMYADRLGCVPEVATVLAMLNDTYLVGATGLLLDRPEWPDDWKLEAAQRHQALADVCEDDAELVLQICAAWERADDKTVPPWEPSAARSRWAARWWVNDDLLRSVAESRREILAALSPAMKEEVKRFVEPTLLRRTRGAISRAMPNLAYRRIGDDLFAPADSRESQGHCDPAIDRRSVPECFIPLARRTFGAGRTTQLANLVAFEPWAIEGLGTGVHRTGSEDAMRLLVLSATHGNAVPTKHTLGALIESWPIGARFTVTVDGSPMRIADIHDVIDPSTAPLTTPTPTPTVIDVDVDDPDTDEDDASKQDAAPELDKNWPTAEPALPDTDWIAARAVLDSRIVEADESACGRCDPCLAGKSASCQNPITTTGDTIDVLADWARRATAGIDMSTPLVEMTRDGDEHDRWEVTGYRIDTTGEPVIVLSLDWRSQGHNLGPAEHPDLQAGQNVDLIVGEDLKCRRDRVRILYRADRRGRFVLREAHVLPDKQAEFRQIAISLVRRRHGLLDSLIEGSELTGTVLPHVQPGCSTVTLLELLAHHLETAYPTGPPKIAVMTKAGTRRVPMYPAVVVAPPNKAGFVDLELLAVDATVGLIHVASAAPGKDVEAPPVGSGLAIGFGHETADLAIRDIALDAVRAIIGAERDLAIVAHDLSTDGADVDIDAAADTPTDPENDSDRDGTDLEPVEEEVGGYDTVLRAKRPVPREVATLLVDLSDDRAWRSNVWIFWARSRHLYVTRTPAHKLDSSDVFDLPATINHDRPDASVAALEEATARYGGGTFRATVISVNPAGSMAWLELEDGTGAVVHKTGVGTRGVKTLTGLLEQEAVVDALVSEVTWHKGAVSLKVTLRGIGNRPTGFATVEDALEAHPVGSIVTGTISGITANGDRAWLQLSDGTVGTVQARHAGKRGVDSLHPHLTRDADCQATVAGAHLHRDQVQLALGLPDIHTPDPLEQAQDLYRIGGSTIATVDKVNDTNGRAWLLLPDGTTATVTRFAVGHAPLLLLSSVLRRGQQVGVVVEEVSEYREKPQVRVSIPDAIVPTIVEQAAAVGVLPDAELVVTVTNVNEKLGLFAEVYPGLGDGKVSLGSLPGRSASGFSRNDRLRVVVLSVAEQRDRAGKLLIGLRFIRRE